MPFGIGVEDVAGGFERHLFADAGHDVLQRAAVGGVVVDVVGGQDGAAVGARHPVEPLDLREIVAAIAVGGGDVVEAGEGGDHLGQCRLERIEVFARHGDEGDPLCVKRDFAQQQVAFALGAAHLAEAEHPRQAAIGGAVARVGEQARRIHRIDPAPDQRPHPRPRRRAVHPHHPRERVAIGHPDHIHPQLERGQRQLDRIRRPAQETERGRDAQLDEIGAGDRRRWKIIVADQLAAGEAVLVRHDTPTFLRK